MHIISFSGRKSSGKTECAYYLEKKGYKILNFADALKKLLSNTLLISNNELENKKNTCENFLLDEQQCKYVSYKLNIDISIVNELLLNKWFTIRQLLQIVGTDLIRKNNPNWHVEQLKNKIKTLSDDAKICIPDVRFTNEKKIVESLSGECYFIIRPTNKSISNHVSEIELNWTHFGNNIIINDSNKDVLLNRMKEVLHNKTKTHDEKLNFMKTQLFLKLNCKNAYLAGILFLNKKLTDSSLPTSLSPFVNENYKLWNCSNKKYPDIIDVQTDNEIEKEYYIKIWLKGVFDYLVRKPIINDK